MKISFSGTHKKELFNFIKENCILEGNFQYKSGLIGKYYIDLDPLWRSIDTPLLYFPTNNYFSTLFVSEGGACNLVDIMFPYFKKISLLNSGHIIYPSIEAGTITEACIIDDVITTGNTILQLYDLIPRFITKVYAFVFVDRRNKENLIKDNLRVKGIELTTLFNIDEFILKV